MTSAYSELLHKVSFEEIIPYLNDTDSKLLFGYKQHYDILRQLEPIAAGEEYDGFKIIEIDRAPSEFGGKLQTVCLVCEPWQYSLANKIVLAGNTEASLAEITACCLWYSSYWFCQ